MNLINFCLANPVKVAVAVLLVVLFGLIGLTFMPIQLTPEVERPEIQITTRWPGAGPHEVEREIVHVQEEQLKSIPGLIAVTSQIGEGRGEINLEFSVGTDMRDALVKVTNRLQQVKEYPPNADEPVVTPSTSSDRPIAYLILKPLPERSDLNITEFGKFTEDYVASRLKQVAGVGEAEVSGGREPELQVVVDPQKLASHQLTIGALRRALVAENKDTSGGTFQEGKRQYGVRTLGQFTTPEQVENLIVAYSDGSPIYVKDVGFVRPGFKKQVTIVRRGGDSGISIRITREVGANVLRVLNGVQERVDELNANLLHHRGLMLTISYDERAYILSSIGLVRDNIYWGTALTAIILFCFLRAWRSTAIICLTIPISIVGTFLVVWTMGLSLNVVSLAGLAFAVGMVVDNAVVVLDNIHRRWQEGETVGDAARNGAVEVWGAVLASTLSTLAVYIPVIFIRQEAGQLFRDIAIANGVAVGLSLIVSVTVIPVAAKRFLHSASDWELGSVDGAGERPTRRRSVWSRLRSAWERLIRVVFGPLVRLGEAFTALVVWICVTLQRGVLRRVVVLASFLAASAGLSWLIVPPREYLPDGNRNLVFASLMPPPGYNTDELLELGRQIESRLRPYWEARPGGPEESKLGGPAISDIFFIGRDRRIFMGVRSADLLRGRELVPVVQKATSGIPGTIASVSQASLFERTSSGSRSVDVDVSGPELERLVRIGATIRDRAMQLIPGAQVVPRPSLDLSSPEVHVVPRWPQAAEMGLSASEIGYAVDALTDGAYASDYWSGHDKIDLTIVGNERFVRRTQDIGQLPIVTATGRLVPLSEVSDVRLSSGPEQIYHRERQRSVTIVVRPPQSVALETATQIIEGQILRPLRESGEVSSEYTMRLSGTADKLFAAWDAMKWNLLLALLVTYLLMAGLFESWTYPLIMLISVPPAAVGGFIGLWVLNQFVHQSLDVLTMLGFITLIGIVVNNAILLVHQALQHARTEGMSLHDAMIESVRNRMRPIFMTVVTTLVGLVPLVVSPGAGSELYRGLGAVVLFGLTISTLFTLVLVPATFTLTVDIQAWVRSNRRRPAAFADADAEPLPASVEAVAAE